MRLSYLSTPYKGEPTDGMVEPLEANLTGKFRGVPGKIHGLILPQVAAVPSCAYYRGICGSLP